MDANNESEKGQYPLGDELQALSADADEKHDYYMQVSRVDVPAARSEEKDYWVRREGETLEDSQEADAKRDRFAEDNAKGLAREEEARSEGKPLGEGERAAHESRVRGFEDLEAGRKTQEGFEAGMQRYDARMEREDRNIHDLEREVDQDVRMRDGEQFQWDSAKLEGARARYDAAEKGKADFEERYWQKDAGEADKGTEGKDREQTESLESQGKEEKESGAEAGRDYWNGTPTEANASSSSGMEASAGGCAEAEKENDVEAAYSS
ncbi:MAG: hypothetical protein IK066_03205 [Kiritimatiellae bacterium]|nr:hypothetical protein [Kiritimatiellia bacterium]